jgi:hypothetical protein
MVLFRYQTILCSKADIRAAPVEQRLPSVRYFIEDIQGTHWKGGAAGNQPDAFSILSLELSRSCYS